jgi:hypothetical protein
MKKNKWDKLNKELDDALDSEFDSEEELKLESVFKNAKSALKKYILVNKKKVTEDLQEMRKKSSRNVTIEEIAANLADPNLCKTDNWIAGAKYQSERMYSEEDMAESFMACWKSNVPEGAECKLSFNEWFEQFKKK